MMMIAMPKNIELHNGTHERCDMAQGYCACGAVHNILQTRDRIREELGEEALDYFHGEILEDMERRG